MKFSYVKYDIFHKPVLPVIFSCKSKNFPYQALVDTGADISIIHAEIAEQLGLELQKGEKFPFGGICGQGIGYIHTVNLEIGGHTISDVPVVFSHDISSYGFGILGHERLFSKLKLVFEFNKKQFEIIPKNYKAK